MVPPSSSWCRTGATVWVTDSLGRYGVTDSCTTAFRREWGPALRGIRVVLLSSQRGGLLYRRWSWVERGVQFGVGEVIGREDLSVDEDSDDWVKGVVHYYEGQIVKSMPIWLSRYSAYFCFASIFKSNVHLYSSKERRTNKLNLSTVEYSTTNNWWYE